MKSHVLDNAVWASLSGPHASISESFGLARRYPVDVSPFTAIADFENAKCWEDLAHLVGPEGSCVLTGGEFEVPSDWEILGGGYGWQMTGEDVLGHADDDVVELGPKDVPEMLDLVSRTEPGPFLRRTVELGGYLGFRFGGELVAMAGRRMHPPRWVEISAVCTDQKHQGKGLGGRLVLAVAAGIRAEGCTPFLHVSQTNENAIRLYKKLGFHIRRQGAFKVLKVPSGIAEK